MQFIWDYCCQYSQENAYRNHKLTQNMFVNLICFFSNNNKEGVISLCSILKWFITIITLTILLTYYNICFLIVVEWFWRYFGKLNLEKLAILYLFLALSSRASSPIISLSIFCYELISHLDIFSFGNANDFTFTLTILLMLEIGLKMVRHL